MNFEDERLLLQALKKGDEDAYLYLVDRYNQRLFGYAITLTNNRSMAEDILQNVFMRFWEKRKKLHITSSLQNFLFRSVHYEFINQYKKQQAAILLENKYFESLEKAVHSQEDSKLEKIIFLVTQEIEKLPPKCKEVFMLSRKEGLTNLEISTHLNVSIKTVEAHITKAFGLLKKKLGGRYHTFLFFLTSMQSKIN